MLKCDKCGMEWEEWAQDRWSGGQQQAFLDAKGCPECFDKEEWGELEHVSAMETDGEAQVEQTEAPIKQRGRIEHEQQRSSRRGLIALTVVSAAAFLFLLFFHVVIDVPAIIAKDSPNMRMPIVSVSGIVKAHNEMSPLERAQRRMSDAAYNHLVTEMSSRGYIEWQE